MRIVDELLQPALKYVEQLSGEEHAIIFRYYISGESWQIIADKRKYKIGG